MVDGACEACLCCDHRDPDGPQNPAASQPQNPGCDSGSSCDSAKLALLAAAGPVCESGVGVQSPRPHTLLHGQKVPSTAGLLPVQLSFSLWDSLTLNSVSPEPPLQVGRERLSGPCLSLSLGHCSRVRVPTLPGAARGQGTPSGCCPLGLPGSWAWSRPSSRSWGGVSTKPC